MPTRRQRYDVALNGQGLVLASKPETPKLLARQDDVFGQRFAQGDRDYNDLAKWWYMAQTDWSGGFKDTVNWLDDAKYYYSTNIDAISEPGAIKLSSGITLKNTFTEQITCGNYDAANDTLYVGTDDTGNTKPALYKSTNGGTNWTELASAYINAAQTAFMDVVPHKEKIYHGTIGAGSTYVVYRSDAGGGGEADYSSAIGTACDGITLQNCYSLAEDDNTIWAGVRGTVGQNYIAKSVDNGANWTKVIGTTYRKVVAMLPVGSNLYYLSLFNTNVDFRVYNGSSDVLINRFPSSTLPLGTAGSTGSCSRRALRLFNGNIILSLRTEIYEYNLTTEVLTRVWIADTNKSNLENGVLAVGKPFGSTLLFGGAIQHSIYLFWGNLTYDGSHWYNGKRDVIDSNDSYNLFPLISDGSNIYWVDNNSFSKIYKDSGYKGTADKNYVVFSNFDKVSGIDKIAYSVDIIFKTLVSGDKIAVEYTVGELTSSTTWTVLGNASYATDGAITQKTLFFGDAVIYKKIWFRVKIEGGGTTTPVLYDFVHAYLPMPDYRLRWDLVVKCEDQIQRKDQSKEPKDGNWLRNFLMQSWLTKSILSFEDYDADAYDSVDGSLSATATTITVNGNTDGFPEIGRLLIESEEIFYTGKTKTTFTGCTRGARGTNKATHADNTAISMAHRIIIRNYQEELIIANDPTKAEYLVTLALSEV